MTHVTVPRVIRTVAPRVTVREVTRESIAARAARSYLAMADDLAALSTEEQRDAVAHRDAGRPVSAREAEQRADDYFELARLCRHAAEVERTDPRPPGIGA